MKGKKGNASKQNKGNGPPEEYVSEMRERVRGESLDRKEAGI